MTFRAKWFLPKMFKVTLALYVLALVVIGWLAFQYFLDAIAFFDIFETSAPVAEVFVTFITVLIASIPFTLIAATISSYFTRPKYVFGELSLQISAGEGKYKKFYDISYINMISFADNCYGKKKDRNMVITYWNEDETKSVMISPPIKKTKQQFINKLREIVEKINISQIIDNKYAVASPYGCYMIRIKEEDCAFLDHGSYDDDIIALYQYEEKIMLLTNCWIEERRAVIEKSPPKSILTNYICCNIANIQHLDCATIDEAVNDTKWCENLQRDVRVIDDIVMKKRKAQLEVALTWVM